MKASDIRSIGVLGMGIMGAGIAQTALLAGYTVMGRDLTEEILSSSKDRIINGRFGFKDAIARGKITKKQMDAALSRLTLTEKMEDLVDCDLVIESIGGGGAGELENKDLKLKILSDLDKNLKKEAIIASNTSMFTIADLASVTGRKDKFIGMHWFRPANIIKLVEICWTKDNPEDIVKCIEDLCDSLGKTHIRVKDVPGDTGFVAGRIFQAVFREADKIVEEGVCKPEDIDIAMKTGFRWPMGPMGMRGLADSGWDDK